MGAVASTPESKEKIDAAIELAKTLERMLLRLETILASPPPDVKPELAEFFSNIVKLSSSIRRTSFHQLETVQTLYLVGLKAAYKQNNPPLVFLKQTEKIFKNVEQRNFIDSLLALDIAKCDYKNFLAKMVQQHQLSGENVLWLCRGVVGCFTLCNIVHVTQAMQKLGFTINNFANIPELEKTTRLVECLDKFIPAIIMTQTTFREAIVKRQAAFSNLELTRRLLSLTTTSPNKIFGDTTRGFIINDFNPNLIPDIFMSYIKTVLVSAFPEHEKKLDKIFDLSVPAKKRSEACHQVISAMSSTDSARLLACLYEIRPTLNTMAEILKESQIPQIINLHKGINSMIQFIEDKYKGAKLIIQMVENQSDSVVAGVLVANLLLGLGTYLFLR